jgi:hypothetical protein
MMETLTIREGADIQSDDTAVIPVVMTAAVDCRAVVDTRDPHGVCTEIFRRHDAVGRDSGRAATGSDVLQAEEEVR